MLLYLKNMVCTRCKMVVAEAFRKAGLAPLRVELGEVELDAKPTDAQMERLVPALEALGFELIDDRRGRIIEKIKTEIVNLVHHADGPVRSNLSVVLAERLHYDYNYLSNLFSEAEGTTVEKYFIGQRIEKVKELLVYDELSLAEVADRMGYSSAAYLSAQFKKVTGLTPTYFKSLGARRRRSIDDL